MNRVLTVMFTDIKGFTERTSTRSRTDLRRLLKTHEELMRPLFAQCSGVVVKTIGDAFMVVFESPTNAVICGMLIQERLAGHNETIAAADRLHVRVAINTGECEVQKKDLFGEAVNIAARIESITEADEIWFTESVYLNMQRSEVPTTEVGKRTLKGIPYEVKVYRVLRDADDDRWKALIERARSGMLRDREPDLGFVEAARTRAPVAVIVSLLVVVAVAVGAVVMISTQPARQQNEREHVIAEARELIAADREEQALEQLVAAASTLGENEQLTATIIDAVKRRAGRYATAGNLDAAVDYLGEWIAKKASLATTFVEERERLIAASTVAMIGDADSAIRARAGTAETADTDDGTFAAWNGRLLAMLARHANPQLEAAIADITRLEVHRLIGLERFDDAATLLQARIGGRGVFGTMLAGAAEELEAARQRHAVVAAVADCDRLIAEGRPAEAVERVRTVADETKDEAAQQALVRACRAHTEQLIEQKAYDRALVPIGLLRIHSDLVPVAASLEEQFAQAIERSRRIDGIDERLGGGADVEALEAARALLEDFPNSSDVRMALRRSLQAHVEALTTAGDWFRAMTVIDEVTLTLAWFEGVDEWVRALALEAAATIQPVSTRAAREMWDYITNRFSRDREVLAAAVIWWANVSSNVALVYLTDRLAELPDAEAALGDPAIVEFVARRCRHASRAREWAQLHDVLARMPHEPIRPVLEEIAASTSADGRDEALAVLAGWGQLDRTLALRHHWHSLVGSRIGNETRERAAVWFLSMHETGELEAAKAGLEEPLEVPRLLGCLDNTAYAMRDRWGDVLATCFFEETRDVMLAGAIDADVRSVYRTGCVNALRGTTAEGDIDLWRFHELNIVDYVDTYQYPFVRDAAAFFAGHAGGDRAAQARAVLEAAREHLTEVREYSRNQTASMQAGADGIARWIADALAGFDD